MVKRDNHYEAAFEGYLRGRQIPYVGVDETRRALSGDESLKSLDFIVSPPAQPCSWLVDIKGRRFPTAGKQFWRNWCTADELRSLARWETLFGGRFAALLVFAYNVVGDQAPLPAEQLYEFRGSLYGFIAIRLDHYSSWSRPLSRRWDTVTVPVPRFRALAQNVEAFLQPPSAQRSAS